MSWLEDSAKKIVYKYKRADDVVISGTLEELAEQTGLNLKAEYKESFEYLGDTYTYNGFVPREHSIMTKIVFEKNGRKAVRIQHTNGKSHVRSMSKENFLNFKGVKKTEKKYDSKGNDTGKRRIEVESVLTKGAKEAAAKTTENVVQNKLKQMKDVIARSNARRK